MKTTMMTLFLTLALSNPPAVRGQSARHEPGSMPLQLPVYTAEQLREDFDFFADNLKREHPQKYAFVSEQTFDSLLTAARGALHDGLTELEFVRLLSTLTERIGCYHLGVNPSRELYGLLMPTVPLLPFSVTIIDGRVYVREVYAPDSGVQPGSEVLMINGRSIGDIVAEMSRQISADARNESSKQYHIENSFPVFYVMKVELPAAYDVEYADPDGGSRRVVHLTGIGYQQLMQRFYTKHPERNPRFFPLDLSFPKETSTALLSVRSFGWFSREPYIHAIDSIFTVLQEKKTKHLIIDVRGNGGGDPPLSADMLAHVARKPFLYFAKPKGLEQYYPLQFSEQQPADNAFQGDVYVLMDGGCGSSTGHFLSLVKYFGRATIIGSETGSSFSCNDGSMRINLPNTGAGYNLPTRSVVTAVKGFSIGEPLRPDHVVEYTVDDVQTGNDPVMAAALRMIAGR
ncbi:hypothetical protein JXO52_10260 [bacterium]|nr:hypothetical protein [bacterium]